MSPRSYHPDRGSTGAERKARYDAKRRAERAFSLSRIDDAPLSRQQMLAQAALQRPEQFADTWGAKGQKGRIAKQHEREDVDWARQYDGYAPEEFPADNIWIPTRRSYARKGLTTKLLFKDGRLRSVPIAPGGPMRLIPVTPELEQKALADLAHLVARGIWRTRRW